MTWILTESGGSGRTCLIISHIPTQSGGAWNEMTGRVCCCYEYNLIDKESVLKQNRVTTIATENDLPVIALVQSVSERKDSLL